MMRTALFTWVSAQGQVKGQGQGQGQCCAPDCVSAQGKVKGQGQGQCCALPWSGWVDCDRSVCRGLWAHRAARKARQGQGQRCTLLWPRWV